jgi:hypothetical protein
MRIVWLPLFVVAQAQDPLLWGNLERGPYPVGFRSSIAFDRSRAYDGQRARPILLDVWYPAEQPQDTGLAYARYLRVPDVRGHPWFRERLEAFILSVVSDDLFHAKTEAALDANGRAALDRLLTTPTTAHLDAAPARGPFPVVLYHSGAGGRLT